MNTLLRRIQREDSGVLTFEWILLITVVVIGIVGGLSAVRDAIIDELGDVAGAAVSIDQSYTVTTDACAQLGNDFGFTDTTPNFGACVDGQTNVSRSRSTLAAPDQGPNQGCNP